MQGGHFEAGLAGRVTGTRGKGERKKHKQTRTENKNSQLKDGGDDI